MNVAIALLLLLVGLLNLAPVAGVLGGERLQALYGVGASDSQLVILLRHRALLFGMSAGCSSRRRFAPSCAAPRSRPAS
ncbi:MAG TPA: hypothetical protein VFT98_18110 [Myxococcota bacterium]|nr:hypothetical protein [Myxococcota bacterium]